MTSLNPREHKDQITREAFYHGAWYGGVTLVPSTGIVYYCYKQFPNFVARTNWQSRTALSLMPALFAFAAAGEHYLVQNMIRMADETQHKTATVEWADRVQDRRMELRKQQGAEEEAHGLDHQAELARLYRESVSKGVRIVPGDRLAIHQRVLNFWQENPAKILFGAGIPAIGYIFYSRSKNPHLQFQMQVMHTRVMGQFTVLLFMLTLMGVKGYMDQNGKFITEAEAEDKVEELQLARLELIEKLNRDRKQRQELKDQAARREAQSKLNANSNNLVDH
jgi:uncharacterized protein (UPF0305 family)